MGPNDRNSRRYDQWAAVQCRLAFSALNVQQAPIMTLLSKILCAVLSTVMPSTLGPNGLTLTSAIIVPPLCPIPTSPPATPAIFSLTPGRSASAGAFHLCSTGLPSRERSEATVLLMPVAAPRQTAPVSWSDGCTFPTLYAVTLISGWRSAPGRSEFTS